MIETFSYATLRTYDQQETAGSSGMDEDPVGEVPLDLQPVPQVLGEVAVLRGVLLLAEADLHGRQRADVHLRKNNYFSRDSIL